jgi:Family of unknown function (DUF6069)
MTVSPTTTVPDDTRTRSTFATLPVWRVGAMAGIAAAIATELFALAARAIDVPMEAGGMGASKAEAIPAGAFAFSTLIWTVIGTVVAVVLSRKAKHPAQIFVALALVATVASFALPLGAGDTATATKVTLCLSHVVAAAILIPALALRLSQGQARR